MKKLAKETKVLKAGVIGLGVGERHIEGYLKHPQCKVTSACDFSQERLEQVKSTYPNLKYTKDADDILEDPNIDIVSIASYDNFHHSQIVKAIRNGKHVFVEKPLCLFEDEAKEIWSLLRENPRLRLSSNLILRMFPRFKWVKKKIEEGLFGELFYIEGDYNYGRLHKITEGWRGKLNFYSVVYGGGVHIVDLLMWLTNDNIVEVSAFGNQIASKHSSFRNNDMVTSILRFKSGLVGKMAVNFGCVFPHFHNLAIYGTKATFINGLENGFLFESRDANKKPRRIIEEYPGTHKGDLLYCFVQSILEKKDCVVSEKDVFKAISVCFAIEKATRFHEIVNVEDI